MDWLTPARCAAGEPAGRVRKSRQAVHESKTSVLDRDTATRPVRFDSTIDNAVVSQLNRGPFAGMVFSFEQVGDHRTPANKFPNAAFIRSSCARTLDATPHAVVSTESGKSLRAYITAAFLDTRGAEALFFRTPRARIRYTRTGP